MKKRVLAAILSMAMAAACMTACGDSASTADADPSSKADSSSSVSESSSAASESTDDSDSSADSDSKADSTADSDTDSDTDSSTPEEKQEEMSVKLKIETYDGNNELYKVQKYNYEYDEKTGHYIRTEMISERNYQGKMSAEKLGTSKYEYDKDLNPISVIDTSNGKVRLQYEYDDKGQQIKETQYSTTNGSIEEYRLYEYDENNKCIKETLYTSDGKVYMVYNREYENGKIAKVKLEQSGIVTESVYTYNDKGHLIQIKSNNKAVQTIDYEYEYYDDGGYKKTTKTTWAGDTVVSQIDTYNSEGKNITSYYPSSPRTEKYTWGKLPK